MTSTIKVDTISENTSANGITIDGVNIKDSAIATAGSVPLTAIDIDGGTDIGAAIVDADLFIVDDGAGGTNRKTTAARLKTYIGSFDADAAQVFNESGNDVDFRVESNGLTHAIFVDAGNDHVNIGTSSDLGGVLNVSGTAVIQTADNTDTLSLISTDADDNSGPNLRMYRNSGSPADNDVIGQIQFEGRNDNSQDVVYNDISMKIQDASDGTEDGIIRFRNMQAGTLRQYLSTSGTETVFNEDSVDIDFRVESNGNTHMLFVDAGNNHVNIGQSADSEHTLNVAGNGFFTTADNTDTLTLECTDADANSGPVLCLHRNSGSPADADLIGRIDFSGESDAGSETNYAIIKAFADDVSHGSESASFAIVTRVAGSEKQRLSCSATQTVFNDDSADLDFRVESNAESNFFVIDGGNSVAGIGTTGSTVRFYVQNTNSSNTSFLVQNTASDNASVNADVTAVRAANSAYAFYRMNSSNGSDVEFNFRGDGEGFCDGSFSGGGADYAEYFEWKDGNSSDEDRIGYAVILDGTQIVKATDSDDANKIIGVISGNPAMVGDSAWNKWQEKHVTDDWNRYTFEDYTQTEWKDEDDKIVTYQTDLIPADVTVPDNAVVTSKDQNNDNLQRRVVNSNWDSTITYVPRSDRKEWDTVGLMGKLRLRKGQPTGTNWLKMRDISSDVEEWLVR